MDADYVFDVRPMRNPYHNKALKKLNGKHPSVKAAVTMSVRWDKLVQSIMDVLEKEYAANKQELYIAIGCTWGRHRSVAAVEVLADVLSKEGYAVRTFHRDLKVA